MYFHKCNVVGLASKKLLFTVLLSLFITHCTNSIEPLSLNESKDEIAHNDSQNPLSPRINEMIALTDTINRINEVLSHETDAVRIKGFVRGLEQKVELLNVQIDDFNRVYDSIVYDLEVEIEYYESIDESDSVTYMQTEIENLTRFKSETLMVIDNNSAYFQIKNREEKIESDLPVSSSGQDEKVSVILPPSKEESSFVFISSYEEMISSTSSSEKIDGDALMSSSIEGSRSSSMHSSSEASSVASSVLEFDEVLESSSNQDLSFNKPIVFADTTEVLNIKTSNEYVQIENGVNADFTGNGLTMELWVEWDTIEQYAHLIHLSNGRFNNYMIALGVVVEGSNYKLQYTVCNAKDGTNDQSWSGLSLDSVFVPNQWTHVALTVTPNGVVSFYVDGIEKVRSESGSKAVPVNTERWVNYLGKSEESSDGHFYGRMDNVRIWNRARTEDEIINNLYHTTALIDDISGLLLSYDFEYDPNGPLKVQDHSGQNTYGNLRGMTGVLGVSGNWRPQVDFSSK
ncbi:MAG: LamG domain-containing protein [Fibrobacterales bacterium]